MILISHRGNLNGKDVDNENNPLYIDRALGKGYDVEVDVWYVNGKWYLGHDEPTYEIELDYLKDNNLWCHAKNIEALSKMLEHISGRFIPLSSKILIDSRIISLIPIYRIST